MRSTWTLKTSGKSREQFLKDLARIKGVYVPAFYTTSYNDDGTVKEIIKNFEEALDQIEKRIVRGFESY